MHTLMATPQPSSSGPLWLAAMVAGGVVALVFLIVFFRYGLLYIQASLSAAQVRLLDLVGMTLRKVSPRTIVKARVMAVKAGIPVETSRLEAHCLAGGNVLRVVPALIAANKAGIALSFEQAAAIDLAGRDVLDAVQTSVRPKVLDCPDPRNGRETLDSVAKDGIQLKVKARVTVRTNLERLVGGAGEETIIARVGEAIVSLIGSAEGYKSVIENPDRISKGVLDKGLDSRTAFEIVSIDIADVHVGDNVGARLRVDQAYADKRMAQAEAEKRRVLAVAREQEMAALDRENRAKVTLAEAEIPLALARAFASGRLGVMDYYGMRNVKPEAAMRRTIVDVPNGDESTRGKENPMRQARGMKSGNGGPEGVLQGTGDDYAGMLKAVSSGIAAAAENAGKVGVPFLEAVTHVVQGAVRRAAEAGGNLVVAAKAIVVGVLRCTGEKEEAALDILSHTSRTVIGQAAASGADLAACTRGLALGAIASAKDLCVSRSSAASAAAQGALEGAYSSYPEMRDPLHKEADHLSLESCAYDTGYAAVDKVRGALRRVKAELPESLKK